MLRSARPRLDVIVQHWSAIAAFPRKRNGEKAIFADLATMAPPPHADQSPAETVMPATPVLRLFARFVDPFAIE